MKEKLRWVLGGILGLIGAALLFVCLFTRKKGIGMAAIKMVEAAHAPRIRELNKRLEGVSSTLGADMKAVKKAEDEVRRRKDELESAYRSVGMTQQERQERLRKL